MRPLNVRLAMRSAAALYGLGAALLGVACALEEDPGARVAIGGLAALTLAVALALIWLEGTGRDSLRLVFAGDLLAVAIVGVFVAITDGAHSAYAAVLLPRRPARRRLPAPRPRPGGDGAHHRGLPRAPRVRPRRGLLVRRSGDPGAAPRARDRVGHPPGGLVDGAGAANSRHPRGRGDAHRRVRRPRRESATTGASGARWRARPRAPGVTASRSRSSSSISTGSRRSTTSLATRQATRRCAGSPTRWRDSCAPRTCCAARAVTSSLHVLVARLPRPPGRAAGPYPFLIIRDCHKPWNPCRIARVFACSGRRVRRPRARLSGHRAGRER